MKTVPLSITKVIFPLQLLSRQQLVANVKSVFLRESSRGTDFNFRQHIYHNSTLRYVRTCAQLRKSVWSERAIFSMCLYSVWMRLANERDGVVFGLAVGSQASACCGGQPAERQRFVTVKDPLLLLWALERESGWSPRASKFMLTDRPWLYNYATERPSMGIVFII